MLAFHVPDRPRNPALGGLVFRIERQDVRVVIGKMEEGDCGGGAGRAREEKEQEQFAHSVQNKTKRAHPSCALSSMQYVAMLLLDRVLHFLDRRLAALVLGGLRVLSALACGNLADRSEEHTSELQSRLHLV